MSLQKLTYVILKDGYYILTDNNITTHQYEPFIPYADLGYEGSAKKQIDEMYISDYSEQLYTKQINEKDIPTEYLDKVKSICNERLKKDSTYNEKQYDAVIASLITEGVL